MKTITKTVWVITYNNEIVIIGNIKWNKDKLIREFVASHWDNHYWEYFYKKGYRCRKATLTINIE